MGKLFRKIFAKCVRVDVIINGDSMLVIKNANISTGSGNDTQSVHIVCDNEKIIEIIPATSPAPNADEIIDAKNCLVIPGAIDPHVHFDTPGYTEREDFTHGSMAAAAGGVTTVIDMPDTSVPPVTDRHRLNMKLKVIENMSVIDFALWGGMSGNSFRALGWEGRLKSLAQAGVVGIKCYLLSGMPEFEHLFPLELTMVMREVRELGIPVALHAEDRDLVLRRMAILKTAGRFDAKAYYESRSDPAEVEGMLQGAVLSAETHCPLHIVHVGSAGGAEAATKIRKEGADITLETCAHYLAFSWEDLSECGSILKTAPVVKTKEDSKKLWEMLSDGRIDFLASDHAPCTDQEKLTGSIWTEYAGMPGTQLMLPYIFSEGYKKGRLTLSRLIEATSTLAAKRYGLYPRKGAIAVGSDADFAIIDPNSTYKVQGKKLLSKGKLTPFEGSVFEGEISKTICRGKTVYDREIGITAPAGYGKFIKR